MPDFGNWSLTAAFKANKTRIDRRINELGPLAQIPGLVLFGRLDGLRFTDGQPKNKIVLSADGDIGGLGLTARTTRYGKVLVPEAQAPLSDPNSLTALGPHDQTLSSKGGTDIEIRYEIADRAEFALGAHNVFDVYPDRRPVGTPPEAGAPAYPVNFHFLPYTGFSPFEFNGRYVYGRMSIDF